MRRTLIAALLATSLAAPVFAADGTADDTGDDTADDTGAHAHHGHSGHGEQHVVIGDAGPLKQGPAQIIGARFLDTEGTIRKLGDENGAGAAALVFVDNECPVSARYLGELNDFADAADAAGVDFYAVVSSPRRTWRDAAQLRDAYGLRVPVLFDPSGDLAARLGPITLAEAFVINQDDRMIYRGRIDDRYAGIGQLRRVIRNHDLLDAFKVAADPRGGGARHPRQSAAISRLGSARTNAPSPTRAISSRFLAANCVECHQTGGVAPFALQTYEQSSIRSGMLEYVTAERLMPPWRPHPRFGRFRDERYLSDRQIALFAAWAENADAEGAAEDRAPGVVLPDPGWRHGTPDLVLSMAEPFQVPAKGDDIYRYFVLPSGMVEDRTVVAIDFRPGDPAVVHHANFFVDYDGRARREDAKDAAPGFSVFGTGEFMSYDGTDANAFGIGGWAPGGEPYALPEGIGLWLPKGGDIVIEIHYKLNGKATTDQSQIGFYFADRPAREYIDGLLIGTQDLDIPPGERSYVRHVSMDVPAGFRLVDAMPHMHYIGSRARMTVTFPDGRTQSVFGVEDWDLRWQNIYMLRTPLHIPAGSRIDAWFEWDNSDENHDNPFDPPRRIGWGWKSEDEMAEVWLGVILDDPSRRDALIRASGLSWVSADSKPFPDVGAQ